eukprot:3419363-Rhodomonas_salina.1
MEADLAPWRVSKSSSLSPSRARIRTPCSARFRFRQRNCDARARLDGPAGAPYAQSVCCYPSC